MILLLLIYLYMCHLLFNIFNRIRVLRIHYSILGKVTLHQKKQIKSQYIT